MRNPASFLHFQMRTLLREEDDDPFYRLLTNSDTWPWTLDEDLFAALNVGGEAWPRPRDGLVHWRPLHEDHLAPIALLADPRAARLITPERGRELLATRRG
ncbi:hypothetical protein ACFPOI_16160 [Nonomuraea angiospora]|uniref:Uncharacterized protein n=1 Tax=Nonomuraea angiospora TaxID=46172 RepID=A0ABR9MI76_9ACTN|nr:hypothetical protein [Nonomuraea angiospora]MBE1592167.1 hypothetical protein [Nonomuraea angiospora]